jgi:hypothetical protein
MAGQKGEGVRVVADRGLRLLCERQKKILLDSPLTSHWAVEKRLQQGEESRALPLTAHNVA